MNNKKPGQIKAFFYLAYYALKAQTRNPATFFFGFIFPIVFISIFGLIGGSDQKLKVGFTTNSDSNAPIYKVLSDQKFLEISKESEPELVQKLKQGKIVGVISVSQTSQNPPKYRVIVINSKAFPQETAILNSTLNGITDKTNLSLAGVDDPPISLSTQEISGRKQRYIDFALPGQIGFSLLSTAIFGTVFGLIYLKKAGILKRMFATPTQALTILLAQGASRLVTALLQTFLILVIGVLVFQFYLPNGFVTLLELMILSSFGLVAFLGFGFLISGLSNDENAASPLTNLITLPQFLLSGTFFSTDVLPSWLQPIANNLPLSYFNIAVRKITTEGGTLPDAAPYILGLAIWGVVMYLIAAKTFKWE